VNAPFASVVPFCAPDSYATPAIGAPVAKRSVPGLLVAAPGAPGAPGAPDGAPEGEALDVPVPAGAPGSSVAGVGAAAGSPHAAAIAVAIAKHVK
jgi:hypothetical protein